MSSSSQVVTPRDVIFHYGNRYSCTNAGTKHWRILIGANKPVFSSLTGDSLANSIVYAVRKCGGRFLVKDKDTGFCFDVGDECAQDSTKFALGGNEPHYAETTREIEKVKELWNSQLAYFKEEDALKGLVETQVKEELERLSNQAMHVEMPFSQIGTATSNKHSALFQQVKREGMEEEEKYHTAQEESSTTATQVEKHDETTTKEEGSAADGSDETRDQKDASASDEEGRKRSPSDDDGGDRKKRQRVNFAEV